MLFSKQNQIWLSYIRCGSEFSLQDRESLTGIVCENTILSLSLSRRQQEHIYHDYYIR